MERYIRTQSSPPGSQPQQPHPRQQPPSNQAPTSPPVTSPTHSPPSYTPTTSPPPPPSAIPSQVRSMKKVPSNPSLDPVITQAKMVALQNK